VDFSVVLARACNNVWAHCHNYWNWVHLVDWWRRSCTRPSPTSPGSLKFTYAPKKAKWETDLQDVHRGGIDRWKALSLLFDVAMLVPLLDDWLWDVCPCDTWLQCWNFESGNDINDGIDRWNLLSCSNPSILAVAIAVVECPVCCYLFLIFTSRLRTSRVAGWS